MRPLLLALLLTLPALADDTIVVTGHGEAKVRPDRLEFRFAVAARAEKAADAVTKIGEKSGKVKDALTKVAAERKLAATPVTDGGLEFRSPPGNEEAMMAAGGAGGAEAAGEVMVETTLSMTVDGIDKLKDTEIAEHVAAVVDAAIAEGATYTGGVQWDWSGRGPMPATVTFRMADPKAALAKAWDAAAADAKKRASEIAARFGKQVGDVAKVEEAENPAGGPGGEGQPVPAGQPGSHDSKFSGTGEATITADLKVEFHLK